MRIWGRSRQNRTKDTSSSATLSAEWDGHKRLFWDEVRSAFPLS